MEDKLKDFKPLEELLDSIRDIDGFPIGEDKDIIALSETPYYTACPNPYINDFIDTYGKLYNAEVDTYERKPYVEDISEGKTDPIYMAHTYHTKVPYKAIMKYIKHYTEPGDLILDGFGGSGMTAVASKLSNRNSITLDLSPNASFLQSNYIKSVDVKKVKEAYDLLSKAIKELNWLYEVKFDSETKQLESQGMINFSSWSDWFSCPYCNHEYNFGELAIDEKTKKVKKEYQCPSCDSEITKNKSNLVFEDVIDDVSGDKIKQVKSSVFSINYTKNNKRYEKFPDKHDKELIKKINSMTIPYKIPLNRMKMGIETRRNDKFGLTHVPHLYTKRNLWVISYLFENSKDYTYNSLLKQCVLSIAGIASKMYKWNGDKPRGMLSGTLYVASLRYEFQIFDMYKRKINAVKKAIICDNNKSKNLISTQSATDLRNIKSNSIDYIFTDPPFGSNLMYSELNFINESWLKLFTNNGKEAIMNRIQEKGLYEYKNLMINSFKEYYRILKPNRWITIEFHNSKASVWNAIQESISKAGFIIAQVAVLDKKQGSFKQVTSAGAVSKDLVINAYKPKEEFSERFLKTAGEGMEIDFIKQQLRHLPIAPNVERTEQMLYSKMLAHYIESGFKIKYNSHNFFELLDDNFVEMDGFWFDEKEVLKYNEWKSKQGNLDKVKELQTGGMTLFINNEKTALQWIYNFLFESKTYSEILTSYNQVLEAKAKDEIPELKEMLDNNFFTEEGKYRRPYSKKERKELMGNRSKELDRAWKKILDKAINEKKKMKTVRKEALEHGFKKCYDEENYQDILIVADKLHASILEENGDIMDFVDIAQMKLGVN